MSTVFVKSYEAPYVSERDILRYAGVKETNDQITGLLSDAVKMTEGILTYKVCYGEFDLSFIEDTVCFGSFSCTSASLSKALCGCKRAVVFAATVGVGIDRLIAKYERVSPSLAHMINSFGVERIESLCDTFCREMSLSLEKRGEMLLPRFSAGYGDLDIETQKDIFRVLDVSKKIGACLTEGMLITPTKSVTAIAGIKQA